MDPNPGLSSGDRTVGADVQAEPETFDLFISYASADRSAVTEIRTQLVERGVRTFLDRDNLPPGLSFVQQLERAMRRARAVAVFYSGQFGSWQLREISLALDMQAKRSRESFPVIPVLLRGARDNPEDGFLWLNTWIDLRDPQLFASGIDRLATTLRSEGGAEPVQTSARVCPFRGLRPFREQDAPVFFGRREVSTDLLESVRARKVVALVGASGTGKSSVVQAGLLPNLRREMQTTWDVLMFTPGLHPWRRLAAAAIPHLEPELSELIQVEHTPRLATTLPTEGVMADVCDRIRRKKECDRLLVIADQFEELFTSSITEPEKLQFLDRLLALPGESAVTLLFTMRADFFGRVLGEHRPFVDAIRTGSVLHLGPMNRDELRESIVHPASVAGLRFEEGLAETILDDVGVEPGSLPLMEFCLRELWQKRRGDTLTLAAYVEMGRVRGAIASRAEQAFRGLTREQQEVTPVLFRRLVRISRPDEESGDARMRVRRSELRDDAYTVVVALVDARLLVVSSGLTGEIIEVAHEALIRHWERLRRWIDNDREFMLWRQRLDLAVDTWTRASWNPDCLWHGSVLAEAEGWTAQRKDELSETELQFLAEGVALRERHRQTHEEDKKRRAKEQRERRMLLISGVATLLILTAVVPLLYKERRVSNSRRLAIASRFGVVSAEPHRSLRPALDALAAWHTRDAEEALHAAVQGSAPPSLEGHTDVVRAISYSDDGSLITTASEDATVRLWSPEQDLFVQKGDGFRVPLRATAAAFRRGTRHIASGAGDGSVRLTEAGSGKDVWTSRLHDNAVMGVSFGPTNESFFSGGWDGQLFQVSAADGRALSSHRFDAPLAGVAANPRKLIAAAVLNQSTVAIWDPASKSISRLEHCPGCTVAAMWYPSGERIATAGSDGLVSIWSADGKNRVRCLPPPDFLKAVAVSPDERYIAAGGTSRMLYILDAGTCEQLLALAGHRSNISTIAFPPAELMKTHPQVAAGAEDGTVRIYDLAVEQLKSRALQIIERYEKRATGMSGEVR